MPVFREKKCGKCREAFQPTGPNTKYCKACKPVKGIPVDGVTTKAEEPPAARPKIPRKKPAWSAERPPPEPKPSGVRAILDSAPPPSSSAMWEKLAGAEALQALVFELEAAVLVHEERLQRLETTGKRNP